MDIQDCKCYHVVSR